MHELYELKDKLCEELEEYGKKDLTAGSLDVIDKLAHTVKNLGKIIEEHEEEEGYSGRSYARNGRSRNRDGRSYDGGRSMARGRGRNAERDAMGRYSGREGGRSFRYDNGMSYGDGMEEMVDSIRDMMGELPEHIQKEAQRFVQKLEQEMM